jgi:vacuolar iron transporter family protein
MTDPCPEDLYDEHQPGEIRRRLAAEREHNYLGDGVLGAIDGGVTTFAVVSGVVGGGLTASVALILGFANLLADGFSMAVSNYQATKSSREVTEEARRTEERHIELIPDGEREEVRQIYRRKGFEGDVLDDIVDTITSDKKLWVDTMLQEEYGLALESPSPLKAGMVTFVAFCVAGFVPLVPFLLDPDRAADATFPISAGVTGLTFLSIGLLKGRALNRPLVRSGVETLFIGGAAATIAYVMGTILRQVFGV